ncbi:MAG: hypothetical protein KME16_24725 [Scytolyngbya sp. HA4215-MV1]|jgi:polyhydroxyalkanoate synthesis regulator phasin|nr:hypothetical protein [Scytolyngbya sp. HA4215-MV1]
MNSDILVQLLQKGFRVTLGATASLIEILQDPQKREENLTKLRLDLTQLTEEWAEKGLVTEQEARSFVDTVLSQRGGQASATATPPSSTTATPEVQGELHELTEQIAAIRMELEKLRDKDS